MRTSGNRVFGEMKTPSSRSMGHVGNATCTCSVVLTGEQDGPRGHAYRKVGYGGFETDALCSQAVHVWSANDRIAITTRLEGSELIADAQDDVGILFQRRISFSKRARRRRATKISSPSESCMVRTVSPSYTMLGSPSLSRFLTSSRDKGKTFWSHVSSTSA